MAKFGTGWEVVVTCMEVGMNLWNTGFLLNARFIVLRTIASQGRQNKLLLEVWPRLHHWGAFGHVAWDTHVLQKSEVHR